MIFRDFQSGKPCEAVFAVGNGRALMYLAGPEIVQCVGRPYTSPTAFSMTPETTLSCESKMVEGVACHTFSDGSVIEDAASPDGTHLLRRWRLRAPLSFTLDVKGFELLHVPTLFAEAADAWRVRIPAGAMAYGSYPCTVDRFLLLLFTGSARVERTETGLRVIADGAGEMKICAGRDYPECFQAAREAVFRDGKETLLSAQNAHRLFVCARRKNMCPLREHPLAEEALRASDDTAYLICAQQDEGGGVMAGTNYHLAYIRDEYGVSRGLLACGCPEQAKKILTFYLNTFALRGCLHNAQGMGETGIFHIHEHDESEITGYLLHQAADVYEATRDFEFFRSLIPMLDWAIRVQLEAMKRGMLPFNGDETYVAGGILPRNVLCEGSLEATMLFLSGVRRYYALRGGGEDVLNRVAEAEKQLEKHFFRGGRWMSNSRDRLEGLDFPPFRHGVCLTCERNRGFSFGWLHHVGNGWYACPECVEKYGFTAPDVPRADYELKSVTLNAPYLGMPYLGKDYVRRETDAYLGEFRKNGYFSTRSGSDICLGLDYGLHLYAAAECGLPADDLLKAALDARDESGAWTEYYAGGKPRGTPCRPWESGVNIDGILRYLRAET